MVTLKDTKPTWVLQNGSEPVEQFKALAALAEDLGLGPRTNTACNINTQAMPLSYNPEQHIMSGRELADEVSEQISQQANEENLLPGGPGICVGISQEGAKVPL